MTENIDFPLKRRYFLKTAVGAAAATSFSGCAGLLEDRNSEEVDPIDQEFQYAFQDNTNTLGNIPDSNAVPKEVPEFQVIENNIGEDEWDEMRSDDVEVARDYLSGDLERRPQHRGQEGTVEEIVQRTGQIFERPESVDGEHLTDLLRNDNDDAVRFTRALIHAVDEVTDISSSGGKDYIVPNVAEHALNELDISINGYNLSTVVSSEPVNAAMHDDVTESSVRESPNGLEYGTRGLRHVMSVLTFESDNGLEARYVENTSATAPTIFHNSIRKSEESIYSSSLDRDEIEMDNGDVQFPEHYVTPFELEKGLKMEEAGILEAGSVDRAFAGAALSLVDDAANNLSQLMANSNEGYDVRLTESFVESADQMTEDISREDFENYKDIGRVVYQIFENKLGEDYKGDPIRGYDQPLKIDGTLEEPEFYHLPGERPSE